MKNDKFLFIIFIFLSFMPLGYSLENSPRIEIINFSLYNSTLEINYYFNNLDIIGERTVVDLWISNISNEKIIEFKDSFLINTDEEKIKRKILINISKLENGNYSFFLKDYITNKTIEIPFSVNLKKPISKKNLFTGFSILTKSEIKKTFFIIFVMIITISIIIISRKNLKNKKQ